jgi:hypothetical protein
MPSLKALWQQLGLSLMALIGALPPVDSLQLTGLASKQITEVFRSSHIDVVQ